MRRSFIILTFVSLAGAPARGQTRTQPLSAPPLTAADSAGIREAALNYIDGWYAADGDRMARALHPELAKRNVTTDSLGRSRFNQMSAMTLVNFTRSGGGSRIPQADRRHDVTILDAFGGAASVRVTAAMWVDYMHMAKYNGQWKIVNVLWENSR